MEDFELQNIEYKVIWKKEFLDEICGMANASGGKIYIGKDDDGNTVDLGVNETRRLLETIPNSIVQALNYSNVSVDAKRDDNMEGVFVYKNNILQKIGFIGVHVKKYHTMHGISVNIYNDILNLFNLMNPCGFNNLKVTSIEGQINKKISYDLFIKYFINEFNNDFNF